MGDIFTVTLPDIGEGVVEGEVIEWLKKVGDPLKQDEPVVVVMTDKATVELPAPYPGTLVKQYYQPGQIAIKDKPLYTIEMTSVAPASKIESEPKTASVQKKEISSAPVSTTLREPGKKALASPPVRKLARDLGVDINAVPGSGHEGIVTKEDIGKSHREELHKQEAAEATPILRLPGDEIRPLIGIRHLMAKKMAESQAIIPHFSYFEQVDATRLIQLRSHIKEEASKEGIHLTYMPFLIRALSLCLLRYPIVNSSLDMQENVVVIHKQHNIGVAISTPLGLIVPVLKNVQEKTLQQIIREFDDLKNRASHNKLHPSEMKEATITISNFGVLGGEGLWATPIISYPEAAILGVAKIHKQPHVKNNAIVIRDVLNLSWSFDHRIIDGNQAVIFSHHFSQLLSNPASIL